MKFKSGELEVEALFSDLVKTDDSALTPHSGDLSRPTLPMADPIGSFLKAQAETQSKTARPMTDVELTKLILGEALDVRDAVSLPSLAKRGSHSGWDEQIGDHPLKKSARARERFEEHFHGVFGGDRQEELQEALNIAHEIAVGAVADARV